MTEPMIEVSIEIDGAIIDRCKSALPIEIKQGRSGTDNQPDAPECSFLWVGEAFPGYLGAKIRILAKVDDGAYAGWIDPNVGWIDAQVSWSESYTLSARFTGEITGMTARREKNQIVGYDITATGNMPKLNKIKVAVDWPEETDFNRIERLGIQGGITIGIKGEQTMMLRRVKPEPAELVPILDAIHEVCKDTGGLFWEDREGRYWYGAIDHRKDDPVLILPCQVIEDGISWDTDLNSLINKFTVEYGPDDARFEYYVEDAESIAIYGEFPFGMESHLLTETDAVLLGTIVMRRRAKPYWRNSDVLAMIYKAPPTGYQNLQNLDMGTGVLTEIDSSPVVTTGYKPWSVEGWVEVIDSQHTIQFSLSDRNKYGDVGINDWDDMRQEDWEYWKPKRWIDVIIRSE